MPVAACCAIGAPVQGQWTAIRLHSSAFGGSVGSAAWGDWQGGTAVTNHPKPILWHSSSKEWINLAPGAGEGGFLFGMHADRQVGQFNGHASHWSGTPESRVDLHPAWAQLSEARAVWGDEQVGWAGTTGERAALWRGTAASYVDLHPEGAVQSRARAVAGGQQGGSVDYPHPGGGTIAHAAMWSGTAASFIDLNPPGALGSSISGMWPGQQVGGALFPGVGERAGYWSGTPESFVSLQPPNVSNVVIHATCGTAQVGGAALPVNGAAIWFGSAESVVSLHDFLPPGEYFQSVATAVAFHDGRYYVAGSATNMLGGGEAWLWVGVPAPGAPAVLLMVLAVVACRHRPSAHGIGQAPHAWVVRKSV